MKSRLDRMNDWCGEILDKSVKYDDLITFVAISALFIVMLICMVMGILGGLGYLK